MIYLDNSSTTFKKPLCVKLSQIFGITKYSLNPNRAGYLQALKLSEKIFNCRELLANTINTTPDQIIFTSGCTMALNLGIFGTLRKNGHIITTIFEHNSVLRALEKSKELCNITYTILVPNKNGQILTSDIAKNIKPNTYMVIINHTSNVTGATQNIESIGKLCKKHNLIFMCDSAQSMGHEKIDMQKMNINMLAIAGHKGLYSPTGIGVLAINNIKVKPLLYGGTGTFSESIKQPQDYPDGLESGTHNISGILGLYNGLRFVIKNSNKINKKITALTTYLVEEMNKIKNVEIYNHSKKSGVISFTIKDIDSSEVSNILDNEYHIATRSGLHCAPLVHKYYKTLKNGMTRVSLSYFNNKHEINKFLVALKKIALS